MLAGYGFSGVDGDECEHRSFMAVMMRKHRPYKARVTGSSQQCTALSWR
ncbi:MAG: hypothetical protein HRU25_15890 [Psychrobium sp.]|nr:hypothetical protein [Psychrobium sp.]